VIVVTEWPPADRSENGVQAAADNVDHSRPSTPGLIVQNVFQHCMLCTLLAGSVPAAAQPAVPQPVAAQQSLDDAWWTGPMLAPNAATLPQGHMLFEPYVYDLVSNAHFDANGERHSGPYEHDVGSQAYVLYGVTDRFTAGMIPRITYNEPAGAPNSSGLEVGDLTLQAAYGLTQFVPGHAVPALALVVQETLPSGRYDRLERASDGAGAGAYTTAVALYSQDYFWLPNGRILRARLDLTYAVSSTVQVRDQSVYGTANGFRGHADPGDSCTADAAAEYSLTRNWVLAFDVVYQRNGNTRVSGSVPSPPPAAPGMAAFEANSGTSYSIGFAPAVEYNFNSRIGTLLGVRIIQIGRNTTGSVTPALALNMVF
jgi:Putative MetA-pathway of phenol degradation